MATEYDYWKIFPRMPKKVSIGDITIRDGFQHEERFISTKAKIFYGQEMILAGCRELEVTNLAAGTTPQFVDAEEVMKAMRSDEFKKRASRAGINLDKDVCLTCVTIREPSVDIAIEMKKKGYGPDRILMTDVSPWRRSDIPMDAGAAEGGDDACCPSGIDGCAPLDGRGVGLRRQW